jgi:hypothetical protein
MKLSLFYSLKALISVGFGILYAAVPAWTMSIYGVTLDPAGSFMARFLGASLIGIGLICWTYRNASFKTVQNILLSLFLADSIGFVIALMLQLSGAINPLGWMIVAIWGFFALGNGYYRFMKPAPAFATA